MKQSIRDAIMPVINPSNPSSSSSLSTAGPAKSTNQPVSLNLDPDEDPSEDQLAAVDFTHKSEELKKLDSQIYKEDNLNDPRSDPFKGLYTLQYKGNGPIQNVFFRSGKISVLIQRDCQIWCKAHNVRFLSFKPALINIMNLRGDLESMDSAPAGDISEIVTRQSRMGTSFKVPELTPSTISARED